MSPKKTNMLIAVQQTYLAAVWLHQTFRLNIFVSFKHRSGQAVEWHCLSNANSTQASAYMFQRGGGGPKV